MLGANVHSSHGENQTTSYSTSLARWVSIFLVSLRTWPITSPPIHGIPEHRLRYHHYDSQQLLLMPLFGACWSHRPRSNPHCKALRRACRAPPSQQVPSPPQQGSSLAKGACCCLFLSVELCHSALHQPPKYSLRQVTFSSSHVEAITLTALQRREAEITGRERTKGKKKRVTTQTRKGGQGGGVGERRAHWLTCSLSLGSFCHASRWKHHHLTGGNRLVLEGRGWGGEGKSLVWRHVDMESL